MFPGASASGQSGAQRMASRPPTALLEWRVRLPEHELWSRSYAVGTSFRLKDVRQHVWRSLGRKGGVQELDRCL